MAFSLSSHLEITCHMTSFKPLAGLRVLEFDAIGPVPFCGMMLADHGADITRITRPGGQPNGIDAGDKDIMLRGRSKTLSLDLKSDEGREKVLSLVEGVDVLLEGHRPQVMERLRLGPQECHAVNPALVYCRITGYGQTGPLALNPGHDINYIAQTGALHAMGKASDPPPPPLSLVGDFGGGGMLGAFGVLAAVIHAKNTGKGSVIDTAMVDGSALLMSMTYGWMNAGVWHPERENNILDGAAPFYRCYHGPDGRFIAAGAIEPKFYAAMREALGLSDAIFDDQMNRENWPEMCARMAARIQTMKVEELQAAIDVPEACLSWVISMENAGKTGHIAERQTILHEGDKISIAPAPRFTPSS